MGFLFRSSQVRFGVILSLLVVRTEGAELPLRYWPTFPKPELILQSESLNEIPPEESLLLETLSGLVARRARETGRGEYIWTGLTANPSYDEWFRRLVERTGVRLDPKTYSVGELLGRYREAGVVKGYVLYRYDRTQREWHGSAAPATLDTSANVATSLAGLWDAVAVDESLEEQVKDIGLRQLADVRGWEEGRAFQEFGDRCSRDLLALNDPKNFLTRSLAAAARAFVVSHPGPTYEAALARLHPGSPVLGWGIGDEAALTGPSSRWGALQTATNWCANLPLLSADCGSRLNGLSDGREGPNPIHPLPQSVDRLCHLDWDEASHFISFVLSDGDNVQWLLLNFCLGPQAQQYWACPDRGKMPFGWTIPLMDLAQLCPYTLAYLGETAAKRDDFVLLSGGYYYPDWFGANRPGEDVMAAHAARLGKYMAAYGVRTLMVNAQDWDSPEALRAYRCYARCIPPLLGVLAVQYDSYTGGRGAVQWVEDGRGREAPVVSARFGLWSRSQRPREGGPRRVAQLIREWAAGPAAQPEDRFGWVVDHCWSWFRFIGPAEPIEHEEVEQASTEDPSLARGYRPALWCAEALPANVRVVTPAELLLRLRLAARPLQTLRTYLAQIRQDYAHLQVKSRPAASALAAAHRALWALERGEGSAKAAFVAVQRADRAVRSQTHSGR